MRKRNSSTSNLKKERRKRKIRVKQKKKNSLTPVLPKDVLFLDDYTGPVYRFFSEEWQAEDFIQGKLYLSTLEVCRGYEDAKQGDKEEGHQTYHTGHISGGSDDPDFVEKARRASVGIGPDCTNISIKDCTNTTFIKDAYVLCTTTEFSPEILSDTFGKYCVEIKHPRRFFLAVSKRVHTIATIKEAAMGNIIYKDRTYTGLDRPPGPMGFVKPSFPYADQKEFRFMWYVGEDFELQPFVLDCPEIKGMCKRMH